MPKSDKTARRGGRPPRREGERLSKNRTFRVRGGLDELLQNATKQSGRSVSEEIEFRLEESFGMEKQLGGPEEAKAWRMIGVAIMLANQDRTRTWRNDPDAAESVRVAANLIIAGIAGLPAQPPHAELEHTITEEQSAFKVPQVYGRDLAAVILHRAGVTLPLQQKALAVKASKRSRG